MSDEFMGNQTQDIVQDQPQQTEPQATQPVDPTPEPEPFLKVKYDKEEIALERDKAIELAQKGLNYDRVYERYKALESDPRLNFVENVAKFNGMEPDQFMTTIMTEMEKQKLQKEQDKILQAVERNELDPIVSELMESRKWRQQYEQEQEQRKFDELKNQELRHFIQTYPDVTVADIPQEVWDLNVQGVPLLDAYTRHENKLLKEKLNSQNQENQIKESNQKNANSSTGPLTGGGEVGDSYFSEEEVRRMSESDPLWVRKNLDKIHASMKQWPKK